MIPVKEAARSYNNSGVRSLPPPLTYLAWKARKYLVERVTGAHLDL